MNRYDLKDRERIARRYGYTVVVRRDELDEVVPPFHAIGATITKGLPRPRCAERDKRETIVLPSVHAIMFGAPCAKCWPNGGDTDA